MAAAEYFDPNARMDTPRPHAPQPARPPQQQYPPQQQSQPPRPQQQYPPQQQQQQQPPRPNQSQANLNPPYPISDQPPPYSEQPRPHSQPPPGQRIPQQNYNAPSYTAYRPDQPSQTNFDTHQYPPEKLPQQYPRPGPAQNGQPTPVAPGLSQMNPGQTWPQQRPSSSGNSPYPRPGRSRSHSREKRKHHHKPKPEMQRQKSGGMNTFLGAGGGAIIGDLIFPGMGTLGGALLGGIGGHEYGKKRSTSNPSRTYRRSYSNGGDYYYQEDQRRGRKY